MSRKMVARDLCCAMPLLLLLACGSDSAGDDAGGDSTTDVASVDSSADATDGAIVDASLDGAATDATPPVALHFKCAEADQCDAGTPVCCATLDFGSDCVLDTVSSACASGADCPTTLQPFCTQEETVRLCGQNADCTEPDYDRCCTFQITGHSESIVMCASQKMADSVDASCAP